MARDAVISVRVELDLHESLRRQAEAAGVSVSDLLRAFAKRITSPPDGLETLTDEGPTSFRCEHLSASGVGLRSMSHTGCQMQSS